MSFSTGGIIPDCKSIFRSNYAAQRYGFATHTGRVRQQGRGRYPMDVGLGSVCGVILQLNLNKSYLISLIFTIFSV
jgi:hypothetical protein